MMKRLLVLVIFLISGCVIKPFQPPTKTFEDWIDGKHSELEIKKALLECGYPSPFADYPSYGADVSFTDDTYIKNYRCMLKAGFVNTRKQSFYCNDSTGLPCIKDPKCTYYPACDLSWDKIPNRSITKRLNSPYCKEYPKAEACQIGDTPSPTTTDPTTSQPIKETIPYDYQSQQLETMHQQNQQTNYNQLKSMMPKR